MASKLMKAGLLWTQKHNCLRNKSMDTGTRGIAPLCFIRKWQHPDLDICPGPSATILTPGYKVSPKACSLTSIVTTQWFHYTTKVLAITRQGKRHECRDRHLHRPRHRVRNCSKLCWRQVPGGHGKTYPIFYTSVALRFSVWSSDS